MELSLILLNPQKYHLFPHPDPVLYNFLALAIYFSNNWECSDVIRINNIDIYIYIIEYNKREPVYSTHAHYTMPRN